MTRRALRYILIILCCNGLFLFAPKNECNDISNEPCPSSVVHINGAMSFHMGWDGYRFIDYAIDPSLLMHQGNERQSRPVFIAIGSLTGYALWNLSRPFHQKLLARVTTASGEAGNHQQHSLQVTVFLAGFILVNIFCMFITLWLFESCMYRLSGPWKNNRWLMDCLLVMLTACQLSKIFFWTPHQQLLALFTPVFCVWICLKLLASPGNRGLLAGLSILSGLLMLVYGNMLLTLPCLVSCSIIASRSQSTLAAKIFNAILSILLFALPTIIWITYLHGKGISFSSEEVRRYRQFVWIIDELSVSAGSFLQALATNTRDYLLTTGNLVFVAALLLLCRFVSGKPVGGNMNPAALRILTMTGLLVFVFYWLMGYYADRLTYTITPILLLTCGYLLNQRPLSRPARLSVLLFTGIAVTWIFFLDAPHFSMDYYQ